MSGRLRVGPSPHPQPGSHTPTNGLYFEDELGPLTDEEWARFAAAVGIELEPWQRDVLNRAEDAAARRTRLDKDSE